MFCVQDKGSFTGARLRWHYFKVAINYPIITFGLESRELTINRCGIHGRRGKFTEAMCLVISGFAFGLWILTLDLIGQLSLQPAPNLDLRDWPLMPYWDWLFPTMMTDDFAAQRHKTVSLDSQKLKPTTAYTVIVPIRMTSRTVKVAAIQAAPVSFDLEKSIAKLSDLTVEASQAGADLVVFP